MLQTLLINHGLSQITLIADNSYNLYAVTYLPLFPPQYTWTSSDNNVVSVYVDPGNSSFAIITAKGPPGQSADVIATDDANSLSSTVKVIVE